MHRSYQVIRTQMLVYRVSKPGNKEHPCLLSPYFGNGQRGEGASAVIWMCFVPQRFMDWKLGPQNGGVMMVGPLRDGASGT
jgi:hypothetical protein